MPPRWRCLAPVSGSTTDTPIPRRTNSLAVWKSDTSIIASTVTPLADSSASNCRWNVPVNATNGFPANSLTSTCFAEAVSHLLVRMQTQWDVNSATVSRLPMDSLSAVRPMSACLFRTLRATSRYEDTVRLTTTSG